MKIDEPLTEEALVKWMIEAVARLTRVNAASLDADTAFEDVGLSSMAAVSLVSELSDAFGIEVDALVTWDHPTIGGAARAICEGLAEGGAGAQRSGPGRSGAG